MGGASQLDVVAAFLNTRDDRAFTTGDLTHVPHDELASPGDLRSFLSEHGLVSGTVRVTSADLALARRLREQLRDAVEQAAPPRLVKELPLAVELGGEPRFVPLASGVKGALAQLAVACGEFAVDGTWPRLKLCAAEDCRWAFVDTGKNRLGRWCSMRVCGNRMKARAFRSRHRG
jgi:predicted RNA-binding Zn ribbon-like protein